MALLSETSCPWPVDADSCGLADLDPQDPVFIASIATASSIMTRLSAYTIGTCEDEIRPLNLCRECRSWCCGGADALPLKGSFSIPVWDVSRVRRRRVAVRRVARRHAPLPLHRRICP